MKKIMIVDDSEVIRALVKQMLLASGYTDLLEAEDGEAALKVISIERASIGLYLLDVNMPKLDGIELVKKIRGMNLQAPIIMLTTDNSKAKMETAKNNGATGWIMKPFESDKFIKVVEIYLQK